MTTRDSAPNGPTALWSPDFDAYASGKLPANEVRCVLCQTAPCECPAFGSDEYIALVARRHGPTKGK